MSTNKKNDSVPFLRKNEDDKIFTTNDELFERGKCATCCKVLFVSEYNFQLKRRFTSQDDIDGYVRYTMDTEFDDQRLVRDPVSYKNSNDFYDQIGERQQNILLRPLTTERDLQFFEFAEYNMYTVYRIPRRVFDIQGGVKKDRTLIMYMNKWGDEDGNGVKNQQFTYVHNYTDLGYYTYIHEEWTKQPLHFFLPNTTKEFSNTKILCFEAKDRKWDKRIYMNYANADFCPIMHDEEIVEETYNRLVTKYASDKKRTNTVLENAYQIASNTCSKDDPKQMFVPVFA